MKKLVLTFLIGVTTLTAFTQVPSYVPTNGLLGYWPFNGNANDESGNGNNGTVNGATLTVDKNGLANKAYSFDGVDDYIKCLNAGSGGNTTVTVSFWMKRQNNSAGSIFGYGNNGVNGEDFRIYVGSGNCSGGSISFDNYGSAKSISDNQTINWEFYTIVYDGNTGNNTSVAKIYKNNILLNTICNSVNIANTNISTLIPITFGRYHGTVETNYFAGQLDDFGIWNRVLTQQEITDLYNSCTNPTATITPQSTLTFCQGASVVLNASTGTGYTYEWYKDGNPINGSIANSYTANQSGSYTVKVIDGSCNATSTATTITVNPNPTAVITPQSTTIFCQGGSVILNASTGSGYTYEWYKNGNIINGSTTSSYTANQSGNYTVKVTDGNCNSTSSNNIVSVLNCAGINENEISKINIYPNPTKDILFIDNINYQEFNGYYIKIVSLSGAVIYNQLITSQQVQISMNQFTTKGMYIAQIIDSNNVIIETKKIVLQ